MATLTNPPAKSTGANRWWSIIHFWWSERPREPENKLRAARRESCPTKSAHAGANPLYRRRKIGKYEGGRP